MDESLFDRGASGTVHLAELRRADGLTAVVESNRRLTIKGTDCQLRPFDEHWCQHCPPYIAET